MVGRTLLVLALLVPNYLFLFARHEACHALVALASGSSIVDFHIWPPRGWNLSWITEFSPVPRSALSLGIQASAPYVVDLALVLGSLWILAKPAGLGFWRLNLLLTGLLFPLLDLGLAVAAYWFAGNDLTFIFGPGGAVLRITLSAWILGLCGLSVLVIRRSV